MSAENWMTESLAADPHSHRANFGMTCTTSLASGALLIEVVTLCLSVIRTWPMARVATCTGLGGRRVVSEALEWHRSRLRGGQGLTVGEGSVRTHFVQPVPTQNLHEETQSAARWPACRLARRFHQRRLRGIAVIFPTPFGSPNFPTIPGNAVVSFSQRATTPKRVKRNIVPKYALRSALPAHENYTESLAAETDSPSWRTPCDGVDESLASFDVSTTRGPSKPATAASRHSARPSNTQIESVSYFPSVSGSLLNVSLFHSTTGREPCDRRIGSRYSDDVSHILLHRLSSPW